MDQNRQNSPMNLQHMQYDICSYLIKIDYNRQPLKHKAGQITLNKNTLLKRLIAMSFDLFNKGFLGVFRGFQGF